MNYFLVPDISKRYKGTLLIKYNIDIYVKDVIPHIRDQLKNEELEEKQMKRSAKRKFAKFKRQQAKKIAAIVTAGLLSISGIVEGATVVKNSLQDNDTTIRTEQEGEINDFNVPEEALQDGYSKEGFIFAYHEYCNEKNLQEYDENNFYNFCSMNGYAYTPTKTTGGRSN